MKFGWTAVLTVCVLSTQAQTVVTYEDFGAVGDGKTDDQEAIVKAHAAANERGLPVRAGDGKTYYIGPAPRTAVIRTDVDFGTAKFIIDDAHVALKDRGASVFSVESSAKPFSVKGVTTLKRGQADLGVPLPSPCLLVAVDKHVKHYIRYGANRNNGSAQREVLLADASGTIDPRAPVVWDFAAVTSLTAYPIDAKPLTLRGGVFTSIANQAESKYTYHARNIRISRSNVVVEGIRHLVTGELDHGAPYGGFLSIGTCANVIVSNSTFTAHRTYRTIGNAGTPVSMGSYDLSVNTAVNVSFVHCRQTTDILDHRYWGLFGSNYCKNLLYDDCVFSRFDAHMGVANATVRNSVMGYMGINAIGFGTFLVENTTVLCSNFINLRGDYGSTWEGEFIIRNCVFKPGAGRRNVRGNLVHGSYSGQHDFGYPCFMPRRIVVDGLRVEDDNHPATYDGPALFSEFNSKYTSADYVEKYPYHPTEEVVLKNVVTTSGKPFQLNPKAYLFRNVKIVR